MGILISYVGRNVVGVCVFFGFKFVWGGGGWYCWKNIYLNGLLFSNLSGLYMDCCGLSVGC